MFVVVREIDSSGGSELEWIVDNVVGPFATESDGIEWMKNNTNPYYFDYCFEVDAV